MLFRSGIFVCVFVFSSGLDIFVVGCVSVWSGRCSDGVGWGSGWSRCGLDLAGWDSGWSGCGSLQEGRGSDIAGQGSVWAVCGLRWVGCLSEGWSICWLVLRLCSSSFRLVIVVSLRCSSSLTTVSSFLSASLSCWSSCTSRLSRSSEFSNRFSWSLSCWQGSLDIGLESSSCLSSTSSTSWRERLSVSWFTLQSDRKSVV